MPEPTNSSPAPLKTDLRRVDINPDFWYPLAWSKDLKRGKTIGRRFGRFPIALVRPEEGSVFALEDRCAHRQVPLSLGKVSGEAVQCCYHGWAYGRSGRCIDVPYLGKGKLPNGVKTYPCREAGGMIFIFPGDAEKAESVPLPPLAQVDNPAFKTRRFSPVVKCHYTFMHENLMDMNHQFLHRRQMGQIRARFLGQDAGENFIEAHYSFARTGNQQPLAERLIFGKHHDDPNREQPVEEIVSIRTTYPYQSLKIHDKDGDLIMELFSVYVPDTADGMSTQTFGLLSVLRPKTPFLIDMIWPALGIFTHRIFEEDREIMELEQNAWRELGGDHNVEVFPIVRKLRDLLAQNGVAPGTDTVAQAEVSREQPADPVVV
ncbi:aromatic ring-hydroxylating dioxygenase subunit alpha [Gluconobacter sp. R71646]|uniref:Aromatic ring-hydroxylating dioxygenase subunit alpha n=1 Tax=Gluconobacter potus TaxID=2724927 RepID=A0ABR9YJ86_9PROT|nr:aromatic ring-hydroxylating dioxygenase subunit alpha [Gluconobacter sp. R71656]MBF0867320.1 aromatic ring-hydroxylating dioxygenase subunit alpha [Gluconobacter sp. R75628]MBF0873882.1 aromatic ring-hydroxylating dioxygenase subunit alpha [Gluconobacter sp. R75629]MBF0881866.1 aromatic ring-hydroxylating dioxygenase subunit alpha [Gluconobacter potus]